MPSLTFSQSLRLRHFLKSRGPAELRWAVDYLRTMFRRPPIDDVVLADFATEMDNSPGARLTLVLPTLPRGQDFGGFATGIDIFARLCLALRASGPLDVRVIVTDVNAETDLSIVQTRTAKAGLAITPDQIDLVRDVDATITVRRREVFMTYNWWTTLNFAKVRDAQAALFGNLPNPLIWIFQDYEPTFMGFSSGHMLACAALETSSPLWCIINSSNLANYLGAVGHRPERSFVFEPVISDALRPYLDRVSTSERRKRVLVYGRPNVHRNCFPALIRGLKRWVKDYPEYADWEVISAGVEHDPVDLGNGRKLTSVGKLSLDAYADMMLSCSAGVSLMASPHPSYPPLEMAHFGLRTITNSYFCKDLSAFHPNITSILSIAEEPLAEALAEACAQFGNPASAHKNPEYLRKTAYPFMDELAGALSGIFEGASPKG